MSERTHLINDYLRVNSSVLHNGFHVISEETLKLALHNLQSFERPDMYATLDDKIIIIEHFEFDASKRTTKGMKGKQEEALLEQRISAMPMDDEFHLDKGNYDVSFENWQANFEQTFNSHYARISQYKESIRNHLNPDPNIPMLVGFFIENQYSPVVYDKNRCGELYYFDTIQFANKMTVSENLDFVLFGSYYDGCPRIFYIDRESYTDYRPLIDLTNTNVKLSPVNKNEITMHGAFGESTIGEKI